MQLPELPQQLLNASQHLGQLDQVLTEQREHQLALQKALLDTKKSQRRTVGIFFVSGVLFVSSTGVSPYTDVVALGAMASMVLGIWRLVRP
jgi:hypothetical protein